MSVYDQIVKQWRTWDIHSVSELELRLESFRVLFAYHSGKIENEEITYHDTREIFENGKVVGYTGSPRTLFELQNQKVCYDFLKEKIIQREPLSVSLILEISEWREPGEVTGGGCASGEHPVCCTGDRRGAPRVGGKTVL